MHKKQIIIGNAYCKILRFELFSEIDLIKKSVNFIENPNAPQSNILNLYPILWWLLLIIVQIASRARAKL